MATANEVRQVAIEIQTNIAAVKTAVDAVKTAVDAINTAAAAWVVNDVDGSLPTELDVKAQLEAYNNLNVSVSKPSNVLTDSIASIQAAV